MLVLVPKLFASAMHAALMFGLAPLLTGVLTRIRMRLSGRRGPPVLQPYRDLIKLIQKTPLIPDTATELYKIWPFVSFAAMAGVALLVPGFALNLITAPLSDFITIIGLFAISRAALLLAGLETGFGFGGAGAGRQILFSVFSEPTLLVALLICALIAGNPTIDGMAAYFRYAPLGLQVPLGFALAAILAVALAENSRIPVDHPSGASELGMVRNAMLLEYSGRYLALFNYTAGLRLISWFSLIGSIFVPFFTAHAAYPLTWPLGLVTWPIKLCGFAALLAFFEILTARMRIFQVPALLGGAALLGMVAAIFLVITGRLGG